MQPINQLTNTKPITDPDYPPPTLYEWLSLIAIGALFGWTLFAWWVV